jgi:mutator protein MutT
MITYTLGILEKNSQLLFLLRKNTKFFSHHYGLMGGKVEDNESPSAALIREAEEELGITISATDLEFVHCLNFKNETNENILVLVFNITQWIDEPINKEPDKCEKLAWFSYNNLPENIIPRHKLMLDNITQSILYDETGWE